MHSNREKGGNAIESVANTHPISFYKEGNLTYYHVFSFLDSIFRDEEERAVFQKLQQRFFPEPRQRDVYAPLDPIMHFNSFLQILSQDQKLLDSLLESEISDLELMERFACQNEHWLQELTDFILQQQANNGQENGYSKPKPHAKKTAKGLRRLKSRPARASYVQMVKNRSENKSKQDSSVQVKRLEQTDQPEQSKQTNHSDKTEQMEPASALKQQASKTEPQAFVYFDQGKKIEQPQQTQQMEPAEIRTEIEEIQTEPDQIEPSEQQFSSSNPSSQLNQSRQSQPARSANQPEAQPESIANLQRSAPPAPSIPDSSAKPEAESQNMPAETKEVSDSSEYSDRFDSSDSGSQPERAERLERPAEPKPPEASLLESQTESTTDAWPRPQAYSVRRKGVNPIEESLEKLKEQERARKEENRRERNIGININTNASTGSDSDIHIDVNASKEIERREKSEPTYRAESSHNSHNMSMSTRKGEIHKEKENLPSASEQEQDQANEYQADIQNHGPVIQREQTASREPGQEYRLEQNFVSASNQTQPISIQKDSHFEQTQIEQRTEVLPDGQLPLQNSSMSVSPESGISPLDCFDWDPNGFSINKEASPLSSKQGEPLTPMQKSSLNQAQTSFENHFNDHPDYIPPKGKVEDYIDFNKELEPNPMFLNNAIASTAGRLSEGGKGEMSEKESWELEFSYANRAYRSYGDWKISDFFLLNTIKSFLNEMLPTFWDSYSPQERHDFFYMKQIDPDYCEKLPCTLKSRVCVDELIIEALHQADLVFHPILRKNIKAIMNSLENWKHIDILETNYPYSRGEGWIRLDVYDPQLEEYY